MEELIIMLSEKAPWLYKVVFAIGFARLFMKPLMTFIHEVVLLTPSKKDDVLHEKVVKSKIYTSILWVLDYFASVKFPKK